MVLLFCPAVIEVIRRLALCYGGPIKLRLCVPRKGICLLTAFVMLFEPAGFQQLAQASVRYAELNSASWGQGDRDIHYQYDDNGSLIEKIVAVKGEADPNSNFLEKTEYAYNLQNRLEEVAVTEDGVNWDVTTYVYNDEGIRVEKNDNGTVTSYLIDFFNHTGYAQVLEEWDTTGTPSLSRSYLIGDDVIAQTADGTTQYLLYDGHGSTRQLAEYAGAVSVTDSYSYDGYGVLLQDGAAVQNNPGYTPSQATNLLYAGEYFDTAAQHYYNRARWYDPYNGRFNRTDPFFGNLYDPQSLHKYLYAHANPVNGVDPSGEFECNISGLCLAIMIAAVITVTGLTVYNGIRHGSSAMTIAWQVVQNLAAFMAILGMVFLSGPIAMLAGATLALAFVAGLINIIRSWPSMDTTDKVIMAATFVAFLAFAGATRASVPPQPAIQSGQTVSPLPESYYSKIQVDMRGAPKGSSTNIGGYVRNSRWFWKQVKSSKSEYFSQENIALINKNLSPRIDAQWVRYHPQHQSYMGETLVHHHIGQGAYATPIPNSVHLAWNRVLHPRQGGQ